MFRLLFLFVIISLASLGANWLLDNNGIITMEWLGYHIETTMGIAIMALVGLLLFTVTMTEFLLFLFQFPQRFRQKRSVQHYEKGIQLLGKSLASAFSYQPEQASRLLEKAAPLLNHAPVTHILSARIAHQQKPPEYVEQKYTELLENKDTRRFALLGLSLLHHENGDLVKSISLMEELWRDSPNVSDVAQSLLSLYKKTEQWGKALSLIQQCQTKRRLFFSRKPVLIRDIQQEQCQLLIMLSRTYLSGGADKKAFQTIQNALKLNMNFLPSVVQLADMAIQLPQYHKVAERAIQRIWKNIPYFPLGQTYLELCAPDNPEKKLKYARQLAKLNPEHPDSYQLIAHTALEADHDDIAQEYALKALDKKNTISLHQLIAEIEEKTGRSVVPINLQKKRFSAAPDPSWQCTQCHTPHINWSINCSSCKTVDSLHLNTTNAKNTPHTPATPKKGQLPPPTTLTCG